MPLQLGAYHKIDHREWEPQRTNNFEVVFPDLGELSTIDGNLALPGNASELLTLSVKSVDYPSTTINNLDVSYGNNTIKFAGRPTYGDISITVVDYIGINTERILMAWSKRVYNPKTETVGWADEYKRDGYLIEYSPDGTVARKTQLRGCWPGSVSPGGFDNDSNNIREIQVTFYCDVAIPLD